MVLGMVTKGISFKHTLDILSSFLVLVFNILTAYTHDSYPVTSVQAQVVTLTMLNVLATIEFYEFCHPSKKT